MTKQFRIASLCPSNTEILAALGLLPNLVGIDNYSDYPARELEGIPKLGPDLHINIDRLQSLKPDLTLASLSVPGMEKVVEQLEQAEINHLVLSPHSYDDIFAQMRMVAAACEPYVNQTHLEEVIESYEKRLTRITNATSKKSSQPRVYFEWWGNPVFSPAKENWLTEMSRRAGAVNIFADMAGSQVRDSGEKVIQAQPDYFFAVWTGIAQDKVPIEKIKQREGWSTIPAFREGRFFILSEGLYCRPSPRLIDGLEQLTSILHPDLRNALDLFSPESYSPIRTWNGEWLGSITP